ncbi:MAG: MATE family efflux transporter [Firmicutes bacterium]|nr:MATE family efflux transporter [Bacillota bacterium]
MIQRKNSRINLTEGPIFSSLLRFAVPILLGSIVTQLYNVADSVIVGRFVSSDALAAVSVSGPVMSLINMFMIGLSTGSNVVIAQRMGAKDIPALQKAVSTVAFLTLVCALFITGVGLAVSRPLLNLLNTPQEIFSDARLYLMIIYLGTTGNMIYQMGSGALRGMGDSSWPFYFLTLCSILNVILDLVAVLVLKWGVPGVALATALAQGVSGIGVITRLNRGSYGVKVRFKGIRPDREESGKIIGIGLPAAIQNIGNLIANLFVQSSVNFFGPTFIAANSIVNKVDDVINIPVVALSTALCTYVGQNMGLFRMDRIKKEINYSILSLTVLGAGLCGVLIAFRGIFPRLFTTDLAVIAIAADGLMIMSFQCLFHGTDRCLVNAMRGAGKSVVPMVTAQFGAFSRIPLAYLLGVRTGDWHGIFWALLIASFLRSAAIAIYYYGGGWKRAVQRFEQKHRESQGTESPAD